MSLALIVVIVYALFCGIGGYIGFMKAQSRASLIAGTISELALFICAYGIYVGFRPAFIVSALIAAALGGRFTRTYMVNQRIMPDLTMVGLSLLTFIVVMNHLMTT